MGIGLRLVNPTPLLQLRIVCQRTSSSRTFTRLALSTLSTTPRLSTSHLPHSRILTALSQSKLTSIRYASSSNVDGSIHSIREITQAEAEADADPNNVDAQVRLFHLLSETGRVAGCNVLMSRWERMCEFNPSSPLLHSDQAFMYYTMALKQTGNSSSIVSAVARREQLLRAHPLPVDSVPHEGNATNTPNNHPLSRSQQIVQRVFEMGLASSQKSGLGLESKLRGATVLGGKGTAPENPIYITIAEGKGETAKKIAKSIAWFGFSAFCLLIIFSLFLENTNLLKTGPRAAEFEPMKGKVVKFSDIHGVDEAKEELKDVVDFLKNPAAFSALGGKLPKGILLTGSPGTGKTMLARAVAGEAGVPFLFASGSEFEEVYVGVGAKRVRDLFATARKKQPAIIFIDELDAIGGKRSNREHQHLKQTLNQLLVEMDGFMQSEGVIVIAATNYPQSLDQALVRPGRFDRIVAVPLPDVRGRVQILNHFMKDVVTASGVDPMILARGTPGFSGADLQNMVNQAAIQASKEGAKEVNLKHFEWAKDRIIMGAERKTHYIEPKDKKCTAYHEGGHALVALYTEGAMPLHKVTCVTRGHALGLTQFLPAGDRVSVSKKEYQASIDVSMGGRVAEELIYGKENVSSGASSDIRNATSTASSMVRQYGFSDVIGPVYHQENDNTISPGKRELIESEIQRMIVEGEVRARNLLKEKEVELHRLAEALVEYETLDLEEVKKVINGEPIRPVTEKLKEAIKKSESKTETETDDSTSIIPPKLDAPSASSTLKPNSSKLSKSNGTIESRSSVASGPSDSPIPINS